jgi:hypothetical protein
MKIQDLAAAAVAVILVLGLVVLSVMGKPVPEELNSALLVSLAWLFRGAVNNINNRRRPPAPPGEG